MLLDWAMNIHFKNRLSSWLSKTKRIYFDRLLVKGTFIYQMVCVWQCYKAYFILFVASKWGEDQLDGEYLSHPHVCMYARCIYWLYMRYFDRHCEKLPYAVWYRRCNCWSEVHTLSLSTFRFPFDPFSCHAVATWFWQFMSCHLH